MKTIGVRVPVRRDLADAAATSAEVWRDVEASMDRKVGSDGRRRCGAPELVSVDDDGEFGADVVVLTFHAKTAKARR